MNEVDFKFLKLTLDEYLPFLSTEQLGEVESMCYLEIRSRIDSQNDDTGDGQFNAEDKAMLFMRYIRKYLEEMEK